VTTNVGLSHPQVDANYSEVKEEIKNGRYRPSPDGRELDTMETISDLWPEAPPHGYVHIFVTLPSVQGSPTMVGECFIRLFALAQDI
jgi:hypothetical protein